MLKKDQVFQTLKQKISNNEYKVGEKLPGEKILAKELNVSAATLRSALEMLQKAKIINCIERSGNYVADTSYSPKKYLAIVTGDDFENISIASMYYVNELRKVLSTTGDKLKIIFSTQLEKNFSENKWHSRLAQDNISGIFLCEGGYKGDEKRLHLLKIANIPVIQLAGVTADRDLYNFPMLMRNSCENFGAGVKYLLSLGHKNIATLFPNINGMRGFTPETYQDFLTNIGIPQANNLVRYYKKKSQISNFVKELMLLPNSPTAFMCYCDTTAMHVLEYLNDMGYDVPEQVSVMGICGYAESLFSLKPLSIINFHYDTSASEAIKLMAKNETWFGSKEIITKVIPYEIVPKSTTGICKNIDL